MIELVESNQFRLLNILDYLLKNKQQISAKEAAILNSTSLITSQRDLKTFHSRYNFLLDTCFENNILSIPKISVSQSCIVSRKIFYESTSLQLFSSILFHPYKQRHYHCNKLSISDATFYRFVETLNTNLQTHEIKIVSKKGSYYIEGTSELHTRYFISLLLLETYGVDYEYEYFDFNEAKDIVSNMMSSNHRIEETVITFQTFLLLAFIIREIQDFSLTVDDETKQMIDQEKLNFPSFTSLKMTYPQLSQKSYENILYSFAAVHFPWKTIEEKQIFEPKICDLYLDINEAINCIFDDEDMKKLLIYLVGFALNFNLEHQLLINRAEFFSDQFILEHPYFTNKFFEVISKHLKTFPVNMTFQAHFIFYLYLINCPQMYMNMDHIRLKVQSDLGKEHINFIQSVLKSIFKSIDFVDDDYELLIACNATNQIIEDENTYVINDYPNQEDLTKIREKMKTVLIKRKIK